MVFGMLPLAYGLGEGNEQRAPLAHAVIGGVIASTLLTLLVVPVFYSLLDGGTSALRKKLGIAAKYPNATTNSPNNGMTGESGEKRNA